MAESLSPSAPSLSRHAIELIVQDLDEVVYAVAVEGMDMAAGRVTFVSGRVREILGVAPEAFLGNPGLWFAMIHPDDVPQLLEDSRRIYGEGRPGIRRYRMRHAVTGEYRHIEDRVVIQRSNTGEFTGIVGTGRDVTDDVEARSRALKLAAALEHREVLLREVHHRVKNNLQLVSSLLRLQSQQHSSSAVKEFAASSIDRIRALSLVHERLYQSGASDRTSIDTYLSTLVCSLSTAYDAGGQDIELSTRADQIDICLDQAVNIGLIVNELVVNAVKHAFPNGGPGRVDVEAVRDPHHPDQLKIVVRDTGIGLPSGFNPATSTTIGAQIVENLARQERGTVAWLSGPGAAIHITLPIPLQEDCP